MKGFIASVITLCLLIGAIIWNGIWVHGRIGDLMASAERLAEAEIADRADLTKELHAAWRDCRRILTVTVSHTEIEGIDSRMASLLSYTDPDESTDFDAALSQLREELGYLHQSESLTLEGII